jgi:hypothetical protein
VYFRIPWTHISGRLVGAEWLQAPTVPVADRWRSIEPWSIG